MQQFRIIDFKSGAINHSLSTFVVKLPNAQKRLNDAYNVVIRPSGRKLELMPTVIFTTSDTGRSATTLKPVYRPLDAQYYYRCNLFRYKSLIDEKAATRGGLN